MHVRIILIVEEYDFEYAEIYLLNKSGEQAVLKAGHGKQGKALLAKEHKIATTGESLIGQALRGQQAAIAETEMALPLLFEHKILGALTVQSKTENTFTDDDITALDTLGTYAHSEVFTGSGADHLQALAVGPAGGVYVTGTFRGREDFDSGPGQRFLTRVPRTLLPVLLG